MIDMIIKHKLSSLKGETASAPWNNSSILFGKDVVFYFSKNINKEIVKQNKKKEIEINIKEITGITAVDSDMELEKIDTFDKVINDSKGTVLNKNIEAIESFENELINQKNMLFSCEWSQKNYIRLNDGNHRFSILRDNIIRNKKQLSLEVIQIPYGIDNGKLEKLDEKYLFYIVSKKVEDSLIKLDQEHGNKDNTFIDYKDSKKCLCIKRNNIGNFIGDYIEKNCGAINIIKEIQKYVKNDE